MSAKIGKWNEPTEAQKEITKHKRTISRLRSEVKRLKSEKALLQEVCTSAQRLYHEVRNGSDNEYIEYAMAELTRTIRELV